MDPERLAFLFGSNHPDLDPHDEEEITAFFESELLASRDEDGDNRHDGDDDEDLDDDGDSLVGSRALIRMVVARQILGDELPEAWQTVQRLRASGLDREGILQQMTLAAMHEIQRALGDEGTERDPDHYRSLLSRLPLPSTPDVIAALETIVASDQGITLARLRDAVLEQLGRTGDDTARIVTDAVIDRGLEVEGAVILLSGDRVVHPATLTHGIVLTHRFNESEAELGVLSCVGTDLSGFAWRDDLRSGDGDGDDSEVDVFSAEEAHVGWHGADGWLDDFAAGDLLAVRVGDDRAVTIERLDDEPPPPDDDALLARLRRAYDADLADLELPTLCTDLVLALLLGDPTTFDRPRAPFTELCERAGLEVRGGFVAHEPRLWRAQARFRRHGHLHAVLDDAQAHRVLDVLELADDADTPAPDLRRALSTLSDAELCWAALDELVDPDEDDDATIDAARAFAERLVEVAEHPTERRTAHWVAGVVAERAGARLEADAHFFVAMEADPTWGPLVDRAAWYASLRGDARRAASLWRTLERPEPVELRTVEECLRLAPAKRGRNEPCWCGSGRKLKTCHPGTPAPTPLADRVGWLCSKATGYLVRRGGAAEEELLELAMARAVDPSRADSRRAATEDPIVIDAALTELGWFERFLDECGTLLPDDETLLATSWLLVDRTVYEVEEVRPGDGLVVRDVRTGEHLDIRERTFSTEVGPGQMFCGRAVPDGVTHQLVGGLFPVAPGAAGDVLTLCDEGDAYALCDYVARLHRPPRLVTRENEPLVQCTVVARVPDPAEARGVLDEIYEAEGDGWVEMHALADDDHVLRAQITLDGDTLTASTHSEARADRVLARLRDALPGLELVSDERTPLQPGEMPQLRVPFPGDADAPELPELDAQAREQILDMMEQRWLREPVPALGGVTPVEAAADPTRREDLERLLASFPEPKDGPLMTLRPSRLRAALGLPAPT
jgi:hypothetical protein